MNIFIGLLTVFVCTIAQCAFIAAIRVGFDRWPGWQAMAGNFWRTTTLLSAVTAFLFIGMMVQVYIWAIVLLATGEIDSLRTAAYFSMVNFTSLGYGDITLSSESAILGPMEAANGILMLGLSTSALYSVLRELRLSSKQS